MKTRGVSRDKSLNPNGLHTQSAEPPQAENDLRNEPKTLPNLPEAPPNYRGMIYDMAENGQDNIFAEGLNRLAREDPDNGFSQNTPSKKTVETNARPFTHLEPPPPAHLQEEYGGLTGLKNLAEGMERNRFSPEDMLVCAMIILMLNSSSEDDILMILVLMLLL